MNVFVLNMEYVYGTFKGIECVGVYDTKEKAQKAMEDRIDRTKKNWKEHWDADITKHLNIVKGEGVGVISTLVMNNYFTIVEKEVE